MSRIKLVIQASTERDLADHHELRCFFEDLNQALRRASGGREWVVEGGRTGGRRPSNREHVTYQYVCHISDLTNRTGLIGELLNKYELGDRTRMYETRSSEPGWDEIELPKEEEEIS